jgi:putative ABC transport system permease protein
MISGIRWLSLLRMLLLSSITRTSAIVIGFATFGFIIGSTAFFKAGVTSAIERGIGRLGADLIVAPPRVQGLLKKGLFGGVPSSFQLPEGIDDKISHLRGIRRSAPHYLLASARASCCETGNLLLVGFDPDRDFSVLPWTPGLIARKPFRHEIIIGGGISKEVGLPFLLYGHPFIIAHRLEKTGFGYFDNAAFIPLPGIREMEHSSNHTGKVRLQVPWGKPSLILIAADPGVSPQGIASAIKELDPDVEIITIDQLGLEKKRELHRLQEYAPPLFATAFILSTTGSAALSLLTWHGRQDLLALFYSLGLSKFHVTLVATAATTIPAIFGSLTGLIASFLTFKLFSSYITVILTIPFLMEFPLLVQILPQFLAFAGITIVTAWGVIAFLFRDEPTSFLKSCR